MADQEKKGTIYQQINGLLNLDGFAYQDAQPTTSQSTPSKESKIIIKGNSPEEIHKKGLEIEQKRELQNKFFRTTDRGFQKALQYEAARLPAYIDYEGMEYYPIISSALDLFMEEATTIGMNGKMLNIYSNKERIKSLLEEFFYNTVNINVNLPFWVRNTVKYGDDFLLLYGERRKGITHVKQLVNYEIERFERIQNGQPLIRFKERMTGDEFNTFEIAHFRLLGDDKYLPYGSCIAKSTKILTENGYSDIQDIKTGDLIYSFDVEFQEKIITKVLDVVCNGEKQTYKISTQHNFVKATDNHKFLIYDYNDKSFKYKLVSELNIGDGLVTNSFDMFDEDVRINKNNDVKEFNGRIYNKHLENIDSIPEFINEDFAKLFGFLLGDGTIRVDRPSMVSFAYGKNESDNKKYIDLMEKLSNKKIYLRKNNKYANGIASAVINSKTFAEAFVNMGFVGKATTKRIPEWVYSASNEIKKAFLEGFTDADGTVSIDKWNCIKYQIEISNFELLNDLKTLIQSIGWKSGGINKRKKRERPTFIKGIEVKNIADSYVMYYYQSNLKQNKCDLIDGKINDNFIIEKIKSIELDEILPVYDIHVDNENHNFYANNIVVHNSVLNKVRRVFRQLVMAEDAMLTYRIIRAGEKKVFKIDVGNLDEDDIEEYIYKVATKFKKTAQIAPNDGQIDYRFNILGNDEDYFLPVKNANTQTGIETLPGAQNLNDIADIEYLRDNLFVGLGVPKPFLSFQDAAGAGKNMAQYDIRFSKKISRIQQAMIQELNKMAMIHLYLLGYDEEDFSNFELTLTNPSTQQELLKSELMRDKAQTYTELTRGENGIAAMSHTEAKRKLWNMSDREIVEDLKQQKMEKVVMQELADAPVTIKKSGLFTDIDKRFGEPEMGLIGTSGGTEQGMPPTGAPAGGGMPPVGGGTPMPPVGGGAPMPPVGGGGAPAGGGGAMGGGMPPLAESKRLTTEEFNEYVEKMVLGNGSATKREKEENKNKVISENNEINDKLNTKALTMINEIDLLLKNNGSINKKINVTEAEDVYFEDIEDIELP